VYIGVFKEDKRLIAVIFDPDIEEFLCKATGRYCDEEERKALKRGGLERVCEKLRELLNSALSKVVDDIVNALRKRLGQPA